MNILLIHLPSIDETMSYVPQGIAIIIAVLEKAGHNVSFIDFHRGYYKREIDENDILLLMKQNDYDILAFGGVFFQFEFMEKLAAFSKRIKPEVPIISGGVLTTSSYKLILEHSKMDICVIGEGERTILELLDELNDRGMDHLDKIDGIAFRREGKVVLTRPRALIEDLDALPMPAYHHFPIKDVYRHSFPSGTPLRYRLNIISTRGCVFNCRFCQSTMGKRFRARSPSHIIEEMKFLHDNYSIGYFVFHDEVFLGPKRRIKDFCLSLLDSGLKIFFQITHNIKLMDENTLFLLKQAGCIQINYGFESGSDSILKDMNKNIRTRDIVSALEIAKKVGIRVNGGFISNTEAETPETLKETRDFIIRYLNPISWCGPRMINYIVILPGTELYLSALQKGLIKDEFVYLYNLKNYLKEKALGVNMTDMSNEEFDSLRSIFNEQIKQDFYSRHRLQKYLEIFGLHLIDYNNVLRRLRWIYIPQIIDGLYVILIATNLRRFQDYIIAFSSNRLPESWKARLRPIARLFLPGFKKA